MSSENNGSAGGGFDFRTLVSLAALVAAGASMFYANSIDSSDKIADLEGSLKSLNTKVNGLPTPDGVKQLISENVTIPAPGPSSEDIQALIEKSNLTASDVQAMIDKSNLTPDDVKALIEATTLSESDIQAQIDKSTLTSRDVQTQIDNSTLSAADVQALVDKPVSDIRTTMGALPDEAKVRELAAQVAGSADRAVVENDLPGLIVANAIPKGAVVAFATECPAEFGWKTYEPAQGRFLVATGRNSDADGTTRTFTMGAGDNDGTYQTTLSVEQLPPHRHGVDRQGPTRGIEGLPPIGSDGAVLSAIEREQTLATGEGKPHNNVPPYIALHFCEKT